MPVTKCLVDVCKTGDTLFRVPRSPILRYIWRKILTPHCKDISDDSFFVNQKVCILHFEQRYFAIRFGHKRRRTISFPTLFTPEEIDSGISALSEFLSDKLQKLEEELKEKYHTDHAYIARRSSTYLVAEISKYIDKHYEHQISSKEIEGPNKGRDIADEYPNNSTLNDFMSENQDDSHIICQRLEQQIYGKNRFNNYRNIDYDNYDSISNDKFKKQDGSQINSKRREDRSYGKNNMDGNNCNSTSKERKSATEHYTDTKQNFPSYSYNLSAPNVIDVIAHEPEEPAPELAETSITDVTEHKNETCITDAKEYGFDGDYFDDGLPTIPEPIPDVPEAIFSWQKELNLFPLDEAVTLDEVAAAEPSLYDPSAPEEPPGAEYQCDECQKEITGFRYTCVQCADWDLCAACEARAAHAAHYLLRIPTARPYNEIQTVLAAIRQQLLSEPLFLPEGSTNDWLAEVKDEPEAGEHSAAEHTRVEESSEESDVESSPRRKRPRLQPARLAAQLARTTRNTPPVSAPTDNAAATDHVDLTDVLKNSSENETFSSELGIAIPASFRPVSSIPTETHKTLTETPSKKTTTIFTSINPPQVLKKHRINLLARKTRRRASPLLKPIKKLETLPIDPPKTNEITRLPDTPIGTPMYSHYYIISSKCSHSDHNSTKQQTNTITQTGKRDDKVPIIIDDDPVQKSLLQTNKKPTLPVNPQRPDAIKRFAHSPIRIYPKVRPTDPRRITRSQFFDEGFDDNLPITVEDDQDNPTDAVPLKSQLITKQISHNSPTRMDVDASQTCQRSTRSKQWSNNMPTVDDKPVQHINKLKYTYETLLETVGGTRTIDQLNEDDVIILDITEAVPDTSLTEESEAAGDSHLPPCPPYSTMETLGGQGGRWESPQPQPAVLRVASGSNEADLRRALQCPAIVRLERLRLTHNFYT